MKPAFTEHALYETVTSNAPVFSRPHVNEKTVSLRKHPFLAKRPQRRRAKEKWMLSQARSRCFKKNTPLWGSFNFRIKASIFGARKHRLRVDGRLKRRKYHSVYRNIWIRGEEGLKKCWYFSCREKFVNYIGDLGRHKKQLDDVNNQQMEELQVLSKTKIEIITENTFPFPTFFYRPCRK